MSKENEIGHCPKCGTKDIRYGEIEPLHSEIYQKCRCNKCGCEFDEIYTFSHQEIEQK